MTLRTMELKSRMHWGYIHPVYMAIQILFPTAVSSNAKYKDIAFDGFEDYGFTPTIAQIFVLSLTIRALWIRSLWDRMIPHLLNRILENIL